MSINYERADELNTRANDLFGWTLLGKADAGDIAELERSSRALQDELTADEPEVLPDDDDYLYPVVIDHEALESWYESQTDVPY